VDVRRFAAVILAGGAGRRLGGAAKPTLAVAGRPMLAAVLAAVSDADLRVVVGPPELRSSLPPGVRLTRERPPGGGPVAALAAGLDEVVGAAGSVGAARSVVVLAADLPLLTPVAVARLIGALADTPGAGAEDAGGGYADGAVYVDADGRRQWLCGVWWAPALSRRLAALAAPGPLGGRSLRELFGPLRVLEVSAPSGEPAPWYDCDTPEQVRAVEALGREGRDAGDA